MLATPDVPIKDINLTGLEAELRSQSKRSVNAAAFLAALKSLSIPDQYNLDELYDIFMTNMRKRVNKKPGNQVIGAVGVMELFCNLAFREDHDKRLEFSRLYNENCRNRR